MNKKIMVTCLLCLTALAGYTQSTPKTMASKAKEVSCKLTSAELQKRKTTVIAELKALILERKELAEGYSYTFNGNDENLDRLNEFIKTERMCCDFFTFQVTIQEEMAILAITGPTGTKEFIKEEIDF